MIELRALTVGYDDEPVLSDVDLAFPKGELTVIIGPNGSGKSTLIKTILGLQHPLGGEILYDGETMEALAGREISHRAAYMAQSRPTPRITAGRMVLHGRFPYLTFPRKYREADYAAAGRAMERTGITDIADGFLPELSGGQRQSVYLAMALAQETETLFMDEPTTYLDAAHQLAFMRTMRELAGQGKAVVMVLHDLCMAMRWADEVVLLGDGGVMQTGTPEEVFASGGIDRLFDIEFCRFKSASGWQYYYDSPAT